MPTKRDQYCRSYDQCRSNSERALTPEIAAIWFSIADSYRFLMEREDRLTTEAKEYDARVFDLKL
jgi:hypothetical protein